MGTVATEIARHVIGRLNTAASGEGTSLTDIGNVIPHKRGADAHPVLDKIPDVPLAQ